MSEFQQRVFADYYSAGGQLSWALARHGREQDGDSWRFAYLGSLRFDALLSNHLVIPDSHVLDGRFFLSERAQALRHEIGRPRHSRDVDALEMPIVLRLRAPTLAETVATFLRTNREQLNAFSFKSIPSDGARKQLAKELKRRSWVDLERLLAREPNPAIAVGRLLRDSLVRAGSSQPAEEWIGPLEKGWSSWLELEREGALRLERYQWGGFPLEEAFRREDIIESELETDLGRRGLRVLRALVAGEKKLRSDANAVLAELSEEAAGDETAADDVVRLDRAYSRARYRAISIQHDAVFVQSVREGPPIGGSERFLERVEADLEHPVRIEAPADVTQSLGELDGEVYRTFLFDHRKDLSAWWRTGDHNRLQAVMVGLADVLAPPRKLPPQGLLLLINGVIVAVVTAASHAAGIPEVPAAVATESAVGGAHLAAAVRASAPRRRMRRRIAEALESIVR